MFSKILRKICEKEKEERKMKILNNFLNQLTIFKFNF